MMKYYERSDEDVTGLAAIIEDQPECETAKDFPSSGREESFGDVHVNGQLSPAQKRDLRGLMDEFSSIFSIKLGQTSMLPHSIEVTSPDPINIIYLKSYPPI